MTDVSADEAAVKRPLVTMCREVVAVLDATKWGRVGLASFASVAQLTTVITDVDARLAAGGGYSRARDRRDPGLTTNVNIDVVEPCVRTEYNLVRRFDRKRKLAEWMRKS